MNKNAFILPEPFQVILGRKRKELESRCIKKKCPHCATEFKLGLSPDLGSHFDSSTEYIKESLSNPMTFGEDGLELLTFLRGTRCPKCNGLSIDLLMIWATSLQKGFDGPPEIIQVYPDKDSPPELHYSIPSDVQRDYIEAHLVKHDSLRAAATLARRCLQNTLRHAFPEMKRDNLAVEINWVRQNQKLNEEIIYQLEALKEAGNLGAHPNKKEDLQIIYELSNDDLEACFLILEYLFAECFVGPAVKEEKIKKLKDKYGKKQE